MKGEARTMETTMTREPIWKLWVDTQRRVVSFHEEAGSQLMEFRDREDVFAVYRRIHGPALPISVT